MKIKGAVIETAEVVCDVVATTVDDGAEELARQAPEVARTGEAILDGTIEVTSAILEIAQALGTDVAHILRPAAGKSPVN
jgi:ubiquinone biosynthesis protein UbiJ